MKQFKDGQKLPLRQLGLLTMVIGLALAVWQGNQVLLELVITLASIFVFLDCLANSERIIDYLILSLPLLVLIPIEVGISRYLVIRADDIWFAGIISAGLIRLLGQRINPFRSNPFNLPLIVFVTAYLTSITLGLGRGEITAQNGLENLLRLGELVAIFYVAFGFAKKSDVPRYFKLIVLSSLAVVVLDFLQYRFNLFTTILYDPEFGGPGLSGSRFATFQASHDFVLFLSINLIFLFSYLFNRTPIRKNLWAWLTTLIVFYAVINGDVRSFLLFFLIVIIVGGLLLFRYRGQLLFGLIVLIALLPILTFSPKVQKLYGVITSGHPVAAVTQDPSFEIRTTNWPVVIEEWRHHPFFGNGPGFFQHTADRLHLEKSTIDNAYLRVLGENGIIGLIGYVSLYLTLFNFSFKAARQRSDLQPFFIAIFLIVGFWCLASVMSDIFENFKSALYFWLLAGIGLQLYRQQKSTNQSRQN